MSIEPRLSSGFKSSNLQFDGSAVEVFRSTLMTAATGGAGDLSNGTDIAAFDCWIKELVITQLNGSTGTLTNVKVSIGTSTDNDKFLDSWALSGVLATSGKRVTRLPFTTSVFGAALAGKKVSAGEIVEFDLDAGATTATHGMHMALVCDGQPT